jgi:Protein of unknown function DUF262/Protein of unknown function (DUF1524)
MAVPNRLLDRPPRARRLLRPPDPPLRLTLLRGAPKFLKGVGSIATTVPPATLAANQHAPAVSEDRQAPSWQLYLGSMADTSSIDFGLDGIGHQLMDRLLAVPVYQRSYAWESDQIQEFTIDMAGAFRSPAAEYFLGTIVLSEEGHDGRITIIDGQQRLATTALFLAAIRDHLRQNGEVDRADKGIHNKYLATYDDDTDEDVPRLFLNADDDTFYRGRIVDADSKVKPDRDSHELILGAYNELREFVAGIATTAASGWADELREWRKFVETSVRVIYVVVPTEADAFLIFETLNDRGVDLTLADLLKNYLFGRAGATKLDVVRQSWLEALGQLDNGVELFITFMRHHWSSKNGLVRERDLYRSIKLGVTNQTQAVKFASDLAKSAHLYAALLSSDHEYWKSWGTSTKDNIDTIGRLALEQNRSMLLAALQHFTKPEMKKTLRSAVSWSVRGLVVGGIGGGVTEKAYSDAALKIRDGQIKATPELLAEVSEIIPSDHQFENAFKTVRVTRGPLARYYLNALERQSSGISQPELVPNSNEEEVNLEHILPKKAKSQDWPGLTLEVRENLVHRLGNLALLKKSHNTQIGNESFKVKKPILANSQLGLTNAVGNTAKWDASAIDRRQVSLAALAVGAWPR